MTSKEQGGELRIWTIYRKPRDYPTKWVARLFLNTHATETVLVGDTLEQVRAALPAGLVRIPRFEEDDSVIMEVWL